MKLWIDVVQTARKIKVTIDNQYDLLSDEVKQEIINILEANK